MRLAHLADVHLGAQFAAFSPELARRRRIAVENALRTALEKAAAADVDTLLLAGDVYEHERGAPELGTLLPEMVAGLAPLRVLVAPGNHDWYGPESLYARVQWPENVHVFHTSRLEPYELDDGLTVWGAAHRAPANTPGFLAGGFRAPGDGIHLGLFHGSEASAFVGQADEKQPYAPFDAAQIADAGLSHVFSGHIHTPVDGELYTYPGNPEPLTFGEAGELVRGLVIATVGQDGGVSRERVRVAQTEVVDVTVDLTDCHSGNEARERVQGMLEGRSGFARITLVGNVGAEADLRLEDLERSAEWMDAIVVRRGTLGVDYDLTAIAAESSVSGQFVQDVLASELPEEVRQKVIVTGLRALEGRDDLEVA